MYTTSTEKFKPNKEFPSLLTLQDFENENDALSEYLNHYYNLELKGFRWSEKNRELARKDTIRHMVMENQDGDEIHIKVYKI